MNSEFSSFTQALIQALGWSLVHFVWQGFVIALILAFVLFLTRKAKAQLRYAVACVALMLCVALPLWKLVQGFERNASVDANLSQAAQVSMSLQESPPIIQVGVIVQNNLHWIVFCWALAVALLSVRLCLGLWWLQGYGNGKRGQVNLHWQAQLDALAQQFALPGRVLLRVVQDIESPLTIGWLRPMVLVPASLVTGMDAFYLQALLAHELAHIRRYDYLMNLIQNLIEMILFFHPAVWWISKKIRNERENIADDLAASMLGEPRRLALALQELELLQFTTPQLAQAAHGGNLMSRIKRLMRPEVQSINWKTAVTAVSITTVCLGFAANAAIPSLSQYSRSSAQNQVATISNESGYDADAADSVAAKIEQLDQASQVVSGAKVSKSKTGDNKDVVKKVRIDFEKPGCRPEYPREALRKEATGVTTLSVVTSAKGRIEKVSVLKSSGHELLDDAVRSQLLSGKCTNSPGMINGKPQATTTQVQYVWMLD
jgi:bla regulator protein BlaR1